MTSCHLLRSAAVSPLCILGISLVQQMILSLKDRFISLLFCKLVPFSPHTNFDTYLLLHSILVHTLFFLMSVCMLHGLTDPNPWLSEIRVSFFSFNSKLCTRYQWYNADEAESFVKISFRKNLALELRYLRHTNFFSSCIEL